MVFLSLSIFNVNAGEISIIELHDGSVISGEVVSFDGNTWTIQTGSMGTLKIEAAKVVSIRTHTVKNQQSTDGASSENKVDSAQIQSMQQSIIANEQVMAMIMNLQNDPEIQAILQDPEIMEAVNAGDINALLANPKFKKFMENSKIKAITRKAAKE